MRWMAVGAVLLASAAPARVEAASLGATCTATQWGASATGLTCAQVSKSKYVWVRLPGTVATTAPARSAAPRPDAGSIPAGQFLVGSEITPGTYRTGAVDCYYKRMRSFTGSTADIIANGFTSASGGIVTIDATDKAFQSDCDWVKVG